MYQRGVEPGNYLGRPDRVQDYRTASRSPFAVREGARKDPRVEWAFSTAETLKYEAQDVRDEQRRNNDMYDGKQWKPGRAEWKNAAVLNYCAWVCDQWAAVLADNKPKTVFHAHRLADQEQADVANAEFTDCYERNGWQATIEDSILGSRIEKKGYLRLTYDWWKPYADAFGDQKLINVSGTQVYVNKEASTVNDCSLLMYEYFDQVGAILSMYPALKDKVNDDYVAGLAQNETQFKREQMVPPTLWNTPQATAAGTQHKPPYNAPPGPAQPDRGTGGVLVREFWMRPRGPGSTCKVKRMKWTAGNRPAVRKKTMEMADGTTEIVQRVITEGNVVYELPMSTVELLRYASEAMGTLKVLHVEQAYEAIQEEVSVPMFPTGRRMVVVGDYVADDGCNPFGHGKFPFIEIDAYRKSRRQFYGAGDIDRIVSLQEYLNRLYALLLDAAIYTSNPLWIIPTDTQIADEDLTNAPGAIIRGESAMVKFARREPGANMPSYVLQLLQFTIQQIREVSGLSETATGGKFKGQQAAETVSMYQEAAGVRFRQGIRNVEHAIEELGEQFLGNMRQFYTQPRLARIKDDVGATKPVTYLGSELMAPMRMVSKAGSMLPTSPSARLNQVLNLANGPMPIFDLPEIWRALEEVGIIESASALQKRIEGYTRDPQQMWKIPALMSILMGGGGKGKGGKSNKGNAGRSARSTTPGKAAGQRAA